MSVESVLARIGAIEAQFGRVAAPARAGQPSFAESLGAATGVASPTSLDPATSAEAGQVGIVRPLGAFGAGSPVGAGAIGGTGLIGPDAGEGGSAALGAQAVALAKEYLGVPYRWGGESPSGFDCSGLVQYAYARLGVDLPRVSRDQARAGVAVASLAEARPGDLVAFGEPVDHIGIYAGDNKMVVAPYTGAVVRVQEITRPISAIRRVT